MQKNEFSGKWKQLRGRVKVWWAEINNDHPGRLAGRYEIFAGRLQQKYALTGQRVLVAIDRRVTRVEARIRQMADRISFR